MKSSYQDQYIFIHTMIASEEIDLDWLEIKQ